MKDPLTSCRRPETETDTWAESETKARAETGAETKARAETRAKTKARAKTGAETGAETKARAKAKAKANGTSKAHYHHGNLRKAALQRGRELVARYGPAELTLRGLARDLGVSATALVYHFGSLAGLRSSVAAEVLEELEKAAFVVPPGEPRVSPERVGSAWIAFAEQNPYLYRFISGEGWRLQSPVPTGLDPGPFRVPSPRRVLHDAFAVRTRRMGLPKGDRVRADLFAFTIHGLALARIDGGTKECVAHALRQLAAAPAR